MIALITAATGVTDPADLAAIESVMDGIVLRDRKRITRAQLRAGARNAWEIVRETRVDPDFITQMGML